MSNLSEQEAQRALRRQVREVERETSSSMREVYRRLRRSPRYYSELLLKIITKNAERKPLVYNYAQMHLYRLVQRMRLAALPVRIIIVKARQVGISTGVSSMIYHHTATRSNISSLIASHDDDSSQNIYKMYRYFYENTDELFKPMSKYSNRKELLLENPDERSRKTLPGLNSRLLVETAKNVSIGRSYTLHNVHLSEFAFMAKAKELMMGVGEAVPEKQGTAVFIESTANGLGNEFHDRCLRAAKGKGAYRLLFVPWFWDPGYTVLQKQVKIRTLCDHDKADYGDELFLHEKLGVSLAQLQWRRNKIEDSFERNVDGFRQEYPSTWEESFVFSGKSLFPVRTLMAMKDACPSPLWRGDITWDGKMNVTRLESELGAMRIWREPEPGDTYVIGADVAEGIEGGDYSSVDVISLERSEQVAHWRGHIDPDEFGVLLWWIGRHYRDALMGVEVNNHGLTTVVQLAKLQYWNQFHRVTFDSARGKRRDSFGWKTTKVTKPLMVDGLRQVVREGDLIINEEETIDEMISFVKHEDGELAATSGKHDDRVMSLAIAVEMAKHAYKKAVIRKAPTPKKILISDLTKMADDMERQRHRLPLLGSWHGPLE